MRIAEYKQIDVERIEETKTVVDYNEYGDAVGEHEETVIVEKPIMGMVYRDMTPEEEAEALRHEAEFEEAERNRPLTPEERMEILEDAFAELCEVIL